MTERDSMAGASSTTRVPLSVVVVILWSRTSLIRCLKALESQAGVDRPEIIVSHDDGLADVPALQREFPAIKFLHTNGRRTYAELRAAGFRHAGGRIIALTEDHCIPDPAWCANILRLHGQGYAAVGGSVDKQKPDAAINWAIYLCDFSRYMNPVPEGPTGYLTDCNVSYKREKLEAVADLWRTEFHETTINWALLGRGETLWLSPTVIVRQQRSLTLGYALQERYEFARLFATTRVAGVSVARRLVYAALSVLLPVILISRVARHVLGKRRALDEFVRALPLIVIADLVWAYGEFAGYLTGRPAESLRPGSGSGVPRPAEPPASSS